MIIHLPLIIVHHPLINIHLLGNYANLDYKCLLMDTFQMLLLNNVVYDKEIPYHQFFSTLQLNHC